MKRQSQSKSSVATSAVLSIYLWPIPGGAQWLSPLSLSDYKRDHQTTAESHLIPTESTMKLLSDRPPSPTLSESD